MNHAMVLVSMLADEVEVELLAILQMQNDMNIALL